MRCKYCFYEDVSEHRERKNMGVMSKETAEHLIDLAFEIIDNCGTINFAFQGGEPTLAGLQFFDCFTQYVKLKKTDSVTVNYAIQTNGFHINEDWAKFFADNDFLVGVSIDGGKNEHDRNRVDAAGNGTFFKILDAVNLLTAFNVKMNALCVVTAQTDPFKSYSSLKKMGFEYIQYIPCLDPYEETRGQRTFSLTPERYLFFLCNLFNLWFKDWSEKKYVSVRLFEDYVHLFMGEGAGTCATTGNCGAYYVIEADGSVFPCDFYSTDEWKMGNINEALDKNAFVNLLTNDVFNSFVSKGSELPSDCAVCRYLPICNGGCKRDRDFCGEIGKNYYCDTFKKFFDYAGEKLRRIALAELAFHVRSEKSDKTVNQ